MTTTTKAEPTRKPQTQREVLQRYPALTAHLVCHSLGYFSPEAAANMILDHIKGRSPACEWYMSMATKDRSLAQINRDTIDRAIRMRHSHQGYMADYRTARRLVEAAAAGYVSNIPGGAW